MGSPSTSSLGAALPASWIASKLHPHDESHILNLQELIGSRRRSNDDDSGGIPTSDDVSQGHRDDEETNRLIAALRRVEWLPPAFPVLVVQHQLDTLGLTQLTDENLRRHFFIDDAAMRSRILSYFSLCLRIHSTREAEEQCMQGRDAF